MSYNVITSDLAVGIILSHIYLYVWSKHIYLMRIAKNPEATSGFPQQNTYKVNDNSNNN